MTNNITSIALRAGLVLLLVTGLAFQNRIAHAEDLSSLSVAESSVTVTVPQTFMGEDIAKWDDLSTSIRQAQVKTINLEIQGFGGDVFAMNRFIAAVKYAQQHGHIINMTVVGPSYSAHANIVCYANSVTIKPEGSLMFHQMKSGESLAGVDYEIVPTDAPSLALQTAVFDQCVSVGRLTKQDVVAIMNDEEVTITHKDGKLFKEYFPNSQGLLFTLEQLAHLVATVALIFILIGLYRRV